MIAGDEGKPMSILERISDEPCDPEPFVEYLLDHYRKHREYWDGLPNDRDPDKPTARDCVLCQLDGIISGLDDVLRKIRRPTGAEFLLKAQE